MAVHTSAESLGRAVHQRAIKGVRALEAATEDLAREAMRYGDKQLSGTVSAATLRRLGHPYARRSWGAGGSFTGRVGGSLPPLPIHSHSGRLKRSRRLTKRRVGKGDTAWSLIYTAEYAKHILSEEGTRTMRGRGFRAALRRHVEPLAHRRWKAAWRGAFR